MIDKKSLSERDICTKFITPAIKKAGWDTLTQLREEVSFTDGKIYVRGKMTARGVRKRADYILYYKPNIEIPLPPLDEQIKFVAEYKKLEIANSTLSDEITNQLDLVKQLRQSFLREVMQGKLVEQNPSDEPATELLTKIKVEKEQLIKAKKIKKQKPLSPITEEEIPENWVWCRLGEIADIERGKSPKYSPTGVFKMLNQKCIRWFYIDTKHSKAIDKEWYSVLVDNFKIQLNDVLVNSTGDGTIGRSAISGTESLNYIFDSHILRVRSYQEINQKLLCSIINSKYGQDLVERIKGATSTKQTELGVNNLSNFLIPLPPLSEQKRIVAKLDELMAYCDNLDESIKNSQEQNYMLLQQVLREALESKN